MSPQGFQLPPQAYDTINNPSPALPNVPPPPKFLQLLILPPQGRMSRLNAVYSQILNSQGSIVIHNEHLSNLKTVEYGILYLYTMSIKQGTVV